MSNNLVKKYVKNMGKNQVIGKYGKLKDMTEEQFEATQQLEQTTI